MDSGIVGSPHQAGCAEAISVSSFSCAVSLSSGLSASVVRGQQSEETALRFLPISHIDMHGCENPSLAHSYEVRCLPGPFLAAESQCRIRRFPYCARRHENERGRDPNG